MSLVASASTVRRPSPLNMPGQSRDWRYSHVAFGGQHNDLSRPDPLLWAGHQAPVIRREKLGEQRIEGQRKVRPGYGDLNRRLRKRLN